MAATLWSPPPALAATAAAGAESAGDAASADAASAEDGPHDPLVARRPDNASRTAAAKADKDAPGTTVVANPSAVGVTAEGTMLYGPPAPKVERGKLAEIGWPEAPKEVPPALENAINIVTRNYPSAKSGRAALRAASQDVKGAKWLRFPSLSANVSYLNKDLNPDPQLVVEAPLWSGGRISSNIRRAKAAEDATSATYVATVEELAQTTAATYFGIAQLTQREQLLADSLREHQRLVQTMERRVEQEVSPLADLELARSRAAQIEQQYTITRQQRETQLRVLAELVADPSYDLGPIPIYDPNAELHDSDALEDQAAAFDPTLQRLNAQADIARADLDARKASILPQVNAQYSYDDVFGSRVGLAIKAQTNGGLSQISDINAARLRIQSALEDRREAEQKLRRDTAADIISFEAAKARASISTRASDTAARVSESYTRQFIAGRRSWLDVMNALREAVEAQIGQSDAEFEAMAAAVRLQLRTGRWRPEFAGPLKSESDDVAK